MRNRVSSVCLNLKPPYPIKVAAKSCPNRHANPQFQKFASRRENTWKHVVRFLEVQLCSLAQYHDPTHTEEEFNGRDPQKDKGAKALIYRSQLMVGGKPGNIPFLMHSKKVLALLEHLLKAE